MLQRLYVNRVAGVRGDLPPAALRLSTSLPVRTHHRPLTYATSNNVNNFKECRVGGVLYESITEAARALGMSRAAVRNRMNGKSPRAARAIKVGGRTFESFRAAYQILGMSPNTLRKWTLDGRARYL